MLANLLPFPSRNESRVDNQKPAVEKWPPLGVARPGTFYIESKKPLKPHHLAQIALRVIAIFLVWRALELGISHYIGFQAQIKIYMPSVDEEIQEAYRSLQAIIVVAAAVPIVLAAILWWLAPSLAKLIVRDAISESDSDHLVMPAFTLLQVAGFVFIALALSTLPQLIFSFSAERRNDPTTTVMTSRIFPEALQFIGQVVVGGIMLLIIKEKTRAKKSTVEQALPPSA